MRVVAALSALGMGAFVHAAGISVSYEPVWPDLAEVGEAVPVKLEIRNDGPDTVGMLMVQGSFGATGYPVELPRGSDKVVTVYVQGRDYSGERSVVLTTDRERVKVALELHGPTGPNMENVGAVCAFDGVLASMKGRTTGVGRSVVGTSCRPENAPTRSVGYQALRALILGEGSERLSDDAVVAIQRYVLAGGTLILTGGPSAPLLRDVRWAKVSPVTPITTRTFPALTALQKRVGEPLTGETSVTVATLRPGSKTLLSQDGTPLIVERPMGLGRVVFWAFDPLIKPIQTWTGRTTLIRQTTADASGAAEYFGVNSFNPYDYMAYSRYQNNVGASTDAFQVKAPPAWKMALILLGFIIVVIPLNFVALQYARRRELAWVTIPVISIVFSGIMFANASGLYSAGSARSTSGAIVTHDGLGTAVFVGTQQLFIPKGGTYDLGFQGVELVRNTDMQRDPFSGSQQFAEAPDFVDVGEVVAPRVDVTNLTYKSYVLTQSVPFNGRIEFHPTITARGNDWSVKGVLVNKTAYLLRGPRLVYQGSTWAMKDVPPGGSVTVDATMAKARVNQYSETSPPPVKGTLAIEAKTTDFPVGARVGVESPNSPGCRLVYTWDTGGQE